MVYFPARFRWGAKGGFPGEPYFSWAKEEGLRGKSVSYRPVKIPRIHYDTNLECTETFFRTYCLEMIFNQIVKFKSIQVLIMISYLYAPHFSHILREMEVAATVLLTS